MSSPTLWWLSFIAATSLAALVLLLGLIAGACRRVARHSAAISATGEQIVKNTAPILKLAQASQAVGEIRSAIDDINRDARRLHDAFAAIGSKRG